MTKSSSSKPRLVAKKSPTGRFHIEFKNPSQKMAWAGFQQHDILFLCGPAGTGKSYLAMAFAINEIIQGTKKRIILTRPIVESGESLGFLPGDLSAKTDPYMMPLFDCIHKLVGSNNAQRDLIDASIEVAPLAFMRGRTFDDAVCIFDEAQNSSLMQLKLFMTRLGENSKMIINGDPTQSDLSGDYVALEEVIDRLENVPGIGILKFNSDSIVRHSLVRAIVDRLGESVQ